MLRSLSVIIFMLSALSVNAQTLDEFLESLKKSLENGKKPAVEETMNLSESEADAFWPIYEEFQEELDELFDKRASNLKDYAEHFSSISGAKADELMRNAFAIQAERVRLNEKYYKRMAGELSPVTAAKYLQIENQIQSFIELTIASEIPLVSKPAGTKQEIK